MHVFGPAALIRAVLPHMRARRSGAIVQRAEIADWEKAARNTRLAN